MELLWKKEPMLRIVIASAIVLVLGALAAKQHFGPSDTSVPASSSPILENSPSRNTSDLVREELDKSLEQSQERYDLIQSVQ